MFSLSSGNLRLLITVSITAGHSKRRLKSVTGEVPNGEDCNKGKLLSQLYVSSGVEHTKRETKVNDSLAACWLKTSS